MDDALSEWYEIIQLKLDEEHTLKVTLLAKTLHLEKFPEEYDYISDSSEDARQRKFGTNPMSDEYILEVTVRREKLGVSPLLENGTFESNETLELMLKQAKLILSTKGEPSAH